MTHSTIYPTLAAAPIIDSHWTPWFNVDVPTGTGDLERLSDIRNAGNNVCGGDTPIGMHARVVGTSTLLPPNPADVIYLMSPEWGLECRIADQADVEAPSPWN